MCEQVTWLKSVAVAVSIGGVVMVSMGSDHSDSHVHTTAMGFVWLAVSVIAYAMYEVRHAGVDCVSARACVCCV